MDNPSWIDMVFEISKRVQVENFSYFLTF
jgi:hypothetical protein